ncbi:dihydrolipoyl dehydrogenase [Caldinitratiruptor microaerophilus]|uniref:Dihydrolipoyl dehydrogenase n=1 Tax=Caldinitratiruptor microaerophilus TaxID=671077 RepID=A0AA35CJE6_9FIRM|nr:dihydrolipoyl dehydrogenase [Caldinitratiruptor microaerophilus]BDG59559.1 dihydrolipoyl dehydrogenase [Caldinitratiruptor microaerophilus]
MVVGDIPTATGLLVLGGGPAGYVAAIRAAQLGLQVTLVEPERVGGTCLNSGCIPLKAFLEAAAGARQVARLAEMGVAAGPGRVDFARVRAWTASVVARLTGGVEQLLRAAGVQVVRGRGWFLGPTEVRVEGEHGSQRFTFDAALVATGAEPAAAGGLAVDGERVLTPQQALALPELPAHLAVCGDDYVALELATAFRGLGSEVTLVLPGDQPLPDFEPAAVRQVVAGLKGQGIAVVPRAVLAGLDEAGLRWRSGGEEGVVAASHVVVAGAVRPRTAGLRLEAAGVRTGPDGAIAVDRAQRTSVPHIYAAGDVTGGPFLAHRAMLQARVAAESAAGRAAAYEPQAVPQVVLTDPEVARVGMSAEEARQQGIDAVTARFPFGANGRALTLGRPEGFVLVVAERGSGVVLGVTVVGPRAAELIGEAALAVEMGANLEDLAAVMHPHPGLGEALQESAELALGRPVHVARLR